MSENVKFEIVKDKIGLISITRERVLNVMNYETVKDFQQLLSRVKDEEIDVLIITGQGKKAFVAGADIKQMSEMNREEFRDYCDISHSNFNFLQDLKIPVLAAVNGYALGGGCELAVACDIRVASKNAKLGFPETKLGLFPCWGGSQRASRLLGIGKAKELIFTGEMITSDEALSIGLVDKVVNKEYLMDEVLSMAEKISANSSLAIGYAKKAINTGSEMELMKSLDHELDLGLDCFESGDRLEGMKAFLEKRTPEFKGR